MTAQMLHCVLLAALPVMSLFAPGKAAAANSPSAAAGGGTVRIPFVQLTAPVPAAWAAEPPANSMRVAQLRVPGVPGSGDAELVVFYFGQGQGGSVRANITRWQSQFSSPNGKPVKPTIEQFKADGMAVTIVELTGSYARGVGMGPAGAVRPEHTLLSAVVETPRGNVTIQLHGPRPTVGANRDAFLAMVHGVKQDFH